MKREIKFRAWDGNKFQFFNVLSGLYGVDAKCIEQYTGLKDRNGKEAYKSDLAKVKVGGFEYTREIYQAESGAWVINIPVIGDVSTDGVPIILYGQEFEIIGNIHEETEK